MKITVAKVKRELIKNHGLDVYKYLDKYEQDMLHEAIKDTLKVVDGILKYQKNISIK